jgi:hypothetical protein
VLRHDVRLAEGGAAQLHRIEIGGGAPKHDTGVEREVRLPREALTERIEHARELEDGAVAYILTENL